MKGLLIVLIGMRLFGESTSTCEQPKNNCVKVLANKVAVKKTPPKAAEPANPPAPAPLPEPVEPPRAKTIKMTDQDIVEVKCARRYETLFLVPANEHIVEAGTGDPERWQVQVADPKKPSTSLHVKPAILGSRTNLNIRTDAGHTYTFALIECGTCTPDMKVFIQQGAADTPVVMPPTPTEVSLGATVKSQEKAISDLQAALNAESTANAQERDATAKAHAKELERFRFGYPLALNCAYHFEANRKPFFLSQVCHDDKFTYLKVNGDTPPALYGEQDGKLSLLPMRFERNGDGHGGTLVVSSVLSRGQLAYGKKKLEFKNAEKH